MVVPIYVIIKPFVHFRLKKFANGTEQTEGSILRRAMSVCLPALLHIRLISSSDLVKIFLSSSG